MDRPRYTLSIGEFGDVYLLDRETDTDTDLGHLDSAATWKRCPKDLRGLLDDLEGEWRDDQVESERVGRCDRMSWEADYYASRGV